VSIIFVEFLLKAFQNGQSDDTAHCQFGSSWKHPLFINLI